MNGRLFALLIITSAPLAGIACTDSAPGESDAWPELRAFGIEHVSTTNNGMTVNLSAADDRSLGTVVIEPAAATEVARIAWQGNTYDLSWTGDSFEVKRDGVMASATSAGAIDDMSRRFFADSTNTTSISIAGIVARERGVSVPWLAPPTPAAFSDDAFLLEESSSCFSHSCSAWDYTTARNCSIGGAYTQCYYSGYSCTRSGDPECSCGWFSCSCTATFCGS